MRLSALPLSALESVHQPVLMSGLCGQALHAVCNFLQWCALHMSKLQACLCQSEEPFNDLLRLLAYS